jgi:hypothetical protein
VAAEEHCGPEAGPHGLAVPHALEAGQRGLDAVVVSAPAGRAFAPSAASAAGAAAPFAVVSLDLRSAVAVAGALAPAVAEASGVPAVAGCRSFPAAVAASGPVVNCRNWVESGAGAAGHHSGALAPEAAAHCSPDGERCFRGEEDCSLAGPPRWDWDVQRFPAAPRPRWDCHAQAHDSRVDCTAHRLVALESPPGKLLASVLPRPEVAHD